MKGVVGAGKQIEPFPYILTGDFKVCRFDTHYASAKQQAHKGT